MFLIYYRGSPFLISHGVTTILTLQGIEELGLIAFPAARERFRIMPPIKDILIS